MTARLGPLALLALLSLHAFAEDALFIHQRIMNPSVKTVNIRWGPNEPPGAFDQLWRCDAQGRNARPLMDTKMFIRAASPAPDGKIVVHVVGDHSPGKYSSRLVILQPGGAILRTIELTDHDLRGFGTPVWLAGGKAIGLTVCKLTEKVAMKGSPALTADPKSPTYTKMMEQQHVARQQWVEGQFCSQPYVATIDVDGKNLKQIAPGALPCWSRDGKTILYTAIKLDNPEAPLSTARVSVMEADGSKSRPVAAEQTAAAWFSPDSSRIAYVRAADGVTEVWTAQADGSGAKKLNLPEGFYASPRWLDGRTIEMYSVPGKPGSPSVDPLLQGAAFAVSAEGTGLRKLTPPRDVLSRSHALDEDGQSMIRRMSIASAQQKGIAQHLDDWAKMGVQPKPIPAGMTVQYRGTEVFFRDKAGKLSPIPDGYYKLPDGYIMHVKNGQKMMN